MFAKIAKFVKEVKVELTKVSWPTRKELIASSMLVIVSVALLATFIGVIDFMLSRFLNLLLQ